MNVMEKPIFPPYVCVSCGMQSERDWFVDFQMNLDNYLNPVINGSIILCNMCFDSAVRETYDLVQKQFGSYTGVEPTYENKGELLTETILGTRTEPDRVPNSDASTIDSATTDDNQSDGNVDSTDDDDEESAGLRTFRGFFEQSKP